MKATGIVRRIDDLGRVVIPKEIRRTMRIREGDPSLTTLSPWEKFCLAMMQIDQRAAFISVQDYEAKTISEQVDIAG